MNPIVHGMLAWIFAIIFIRELRDRRLVVVAGVIPDLDAILLFVSDDLFYEYHHTIGHSFVFGIPLALLFCFFARDRPRVLVGSLTAFSIHLLGDYFATNWALPILYPLSDISFTGADHLSYHMQYEVIGPVAGMLSLLIILIIVWVKERSPFEFISGSLDAKLVGLYVYPMKYRCSSCSTLALFACDNCGKKVCWSHLEDTWKWTCSDCGSSPERE